MKYNNHQAVALKIIIRRNPLLIIKMKISLSKNLLKTFFDKISEKKYDQKNLKTILAKFLAQNYAKGKNSLIFII